MPSDPTKGKMISPVKSLQDAIRTEMYNADDPSDASRVFICEHNLQRAWRDHDLKTIFPPTKYSPEEIKTIRDRFLRVLSVLILVGWSSDDLVNKFRPQFLRAAGREDSDLPIDEEELEFLDTSSYMFRQQQFAFCPAIIVESEYSHIQTIEKDRRLPFSGKPVEVGGGAYGRVSQVTIAPRCLRHAENSTDNFKSILVACKTYTNENSAENFHRESQNLDILKEGLRGSKRVMQHIASIIHGNNLMILLPLAQHGDLEIFLRGGYKAGADTQYDNHKIYDFDETFPHLACEETLHKALLKEMFEIARALVWLHEELHLFGRLDSYLAHLDLKPENILLVQDNHSGTSGSDHPAGKWMLTDFGVSVFEKATNEKATRVHSIRDVGPRLTSRANRDEVMRGRGPYQPPEVDLDKVDGRKCDVWSLACILCDVLAFAFGRGTALHKFRTLRYDGKDDYFYRARGSSEDRARVINSSNTELKSEIKDWFRAHANASTHTWVPHYVSIIERALVPRPLERPDMKEIMQGLDSLPVNVRPSPATSVRFRNSDHLQLPVSVRTQPRRPSITFADDTATTSYDILPPVEHRNGASMAAEPSFWDTPEALAQQSPTYRHYRYQSTSSSNTGASYRRYGEIPVDNLSSMPMPVSGQPSPYLLPRLQPLGKASKYVPDSKTSLTLNSKQSVDAIALTPTGDKVAFLCGRQIHAYLTRDGSRTGTIEELTPRDITPLVKWMKMCIANNFAVTYGVQGTEKLIQVHEFETRTEVRTIPTTFHNEQASDILLSNRDVFVCVYNRWLYLAPLSGGDPRVLEIGKGKSLAVKAACFSESGDLLFVWASGDAHHGYTYKMNGQDATLVGEVSYEKAANDSKYFTLWPYESIPACIVHNSHGSTFIIHPNSAKQQQQPQKRQSLRIPSMLVSRVARDNVLICIQKGPLKGLKHQIFEYELSKGTDGRFLITKSSAALASVERSVDENTKTALGLYRGQLFLILCTMKGEILRYARVPRIATTTGVDVIAKEDRPGFESLPSFQGRLAGAIGAPKDLNSSHDGLQAGTKSKGKESYQEKEPEEQYYGTSGSRISQIGFRNPDSSRNFPRVEFDTPGTRDLTDQSFGDTVLVGGQLNNTTEIAGQTSGKGESMINQSRLQDVLPVQNVLESVPSTPQTPDISQSKPRKDNFADEGPDRTTEVVDGRSEKSIRATSFNDPQIADMFSEFSSEATAVANESNQSTETAAEALNQGEPLRPSILTTQEDPDEDIRSIESNKEEIASQQSTSKNLQEHIAEQHLGDLLAHNEELQPLYLKALARMDKTHLTDNLRRLLKYYYLDLCQSAETNLHRAASRLLRGRWRRIRIAQQIVNVIGTPDEEFRLEIEQRTREKISKLSDLEAWISQTEHLASSDALEGQRDEEEEASCDREGSNTGDESSSEGDNGGEEDILPNIAAAENFLLAGIPFRKLCVSLQIFLLPANLAPLTRIIMTIPANRICFSDEEDSSILNQFRAFVEARTEENWNWWPLHPRMLKLQPSQTRMHWRCHCNMHLWTELPVSYAEAYQYLLRHKVPVSQRGHLCRTQQRRPLRAKFVAGILQAAGSISNYRSWYGSAGSSSATSSQNTRVTGRDSVSKTSIRMQATKESGQQGNQTSISMPKTDHAYVLFGVNGTRRTPELAQINTKSCGTDKVFFNDLRCNYRELRGYLRYWFSLWQFSHCDFVKFEKIRRNRIIVRGKEIPTDINYEYRPRPPHAENPPISPHEFQLALQSCNDRCLLSWLHDCVEPPDGIFAIERIPKRKSVLELEVSAVEFAWGLQAQHAISFIRVILYHFLMFIGTFAFWAWWQIKHPDDLQNAAVPLTILGLFFSLFWSSAGVLKVLRNPT